jgi:hypothetical protein
MPAQAMYSRKGGSRLSEQGTSGWLPPFSVPPDPSADLQRRFVVCFSDRYGSWILTRYVTLTDAVDGLRSVLCLLGLDFSCEAESKP